VRRAFVPDLQHERMLARLASQGLLLPTPEHAAIKDHLRLPSSDRVDRILRYETANNRQLVPSSREAVAEIFLSDESAYILACLSSETSR
jgi:hypothetical protein